MPLMLIFYIVGYLIPTNLQKSTREYNLDLWSLIWSRPNYTPGYKIVVIYTSGFILAGVVLWPHVVRKMKVFTKQFDGKI